MKVKARLHGTLGQSFPGYQHSQGIEVEIPGEATVGDLLSHLGITESRGAVVIAEGRILKTDERIQPGIPMNVFEAVRGG